VAPKTAVSEPRGGDEQAQAATVGERAVAALALGLVRAAGEPRAALARGGGRALGTVR
jgi:hypothetical protein